MKTRVLSLQTPLLGHATYGELLRREFARSETIDFDAHWSTESHDEHGASFVGRQLDRVFLKFFDNAFVRKYHLDLFSLRYEIGTSFWARRTLGQLLRTREPHVLHVHTQAIAMLSLGIMRRIPTVVSIDGTALQMAQQQLGDALHPAYAGNRFLEWLVFRRAAAIVTFSKWAADSTVASYGIDPKRVHVIPPGIELARFPIVNRADRDPSEPVRVLFVGGEFERKGGNELVEAFLAEFPGENVELHLVTRSAVSFYDPRIFVHSDVTAYAAAWHALYDRADIFAMPTKRDQSPNVYLEAMAAGLPIVATDVGAVCDVVIDDVTGHVVAVGDVRSLRDHLGRLVRNPAHRRALGSAGRRRVELHFEAAANGRRLEDVLLSVASDYGIK